MGPTRMAAATSCDDLHQRVANCCRHRETIYASHPRSVTISVACAPRQEETGQVSTQLANAPFFYSFRRSTVMMSHAGFHSTCVRRAFSSLQCSQQYAYASSHNWMGQKVGWPTNSPKCTAKHPWRKVVFVRPCSLCIAAMLHVSCESRGCGGPSDTCRGTAIGPGIRRLDHAMQRRLSQ